MAASTPPGPPSSAPAWSVTGPSREGGGSALAGTVETASNPRTRAARTTARRIRGIGRNHRAVWRRNAAAGFIVEERPFGRVTAHPHARHARKSDGAECSRRPAPVDVEPGSGKRPAATRLRRAEDQDPIGLRRPAGFDAPQLGHLATGRHVVERDTGQRVALRRRGRFPDALGKPDAAPDRAAAIGLDVPDDEDDDGVVGQDRAQVRRTSRRKARYGSR